MQAEARAKKSMRGVHMIEAGKTGGIVKVADISSKATADRFVPGFQRSGRVSAVVEFVSSGGRVRVYVPKETCIATVLLAGVQAPRTGFKDSPDEPCAREAADFTKSVALQRNVDLEVLESDKNGNLVGNIFLQSGESLSTLLVRNGFASVPFWAQRFPGFDLLKQEEENAKGSKSNIWSTYDPAAEAAAAASHGEQVTEDGDTPRIEKAETVVVTHIVSAIGFYAQFTKDAEKLEEVMGIINGAGLTGGAISPKKGNVVAAQFVDGSWYRAKVTSAKDGVYDLLYIDYGNTESHTGNGKLAELPEGVADIENGATEMSLAVLGLPPTDYCDEAAGVLSSGIMNNMYNCNVEYKEEGVSYVTLIAEETNDNVAKTMLSLGYASVSKQRVDFKLKTLQSEYRAIEQEAKTARAGMWMYGDISEDPREI